MIHLASATWGQHGGDEETIGFCSYCARLDTPGRQRVCPDCGLGVLLHQRGYSREGAALIIAACELDGGSAAYDQAPALHVAQAGLAALVVIRWIVSGDATLPGAREYRESATYRGGDKAVVAEAAGLKLGLTICYDVRFPELYRILALQGAQLLADIRDRKSVV